jgi:hypothetical protein
VLLMMAAGAEPDSFSFEKIKRGLDPAYSYIVFERCTEASAESAFREVFEALMHMDFGFYERQVLHDKALGGLLLVIKFGPGRSDKIMQAFMNTGLPKDIIFYAYGSQSTKDTK